MLDLKTLGSALEQLEQERGIPRAKIIEAIEQALAAAYKKDFGEKGQDIRAKLDSDTGQTNFWQVKVVVDDVDEALEHRCHQDRGETDAEARSHESTASGSDRVGQPAGDGNQDWRGGW